VPKVRVALLSIGLVLASGAATVVPAVSASAAIDPEDVVSAYFDAINVGNYQEAWDLGGQNLSSSYASFVDGFDNTVFDSVTFLGEHGDVVDVFLDAEQADGADHTYEGTYTVADGTIVGAHMRRQ
jgi:hypothetical protein